MCCAVLGSTRCAGLLPNKSSPTCMNVQPAGGCRALWRAKSTSPLPPLPPLPPGSMFLCVALYARASTPLRVWGYCPMCMCLWCDVLCCVVLWLYVV